jgi:hypothetical protein
MAEWKKVIVSGSNAELNNIFAGGSITGSNISSSGNLFASLSVSGNTNYKTVVVDPTTGKFYQTGSYGGAGGIFINQGTFYNTQNTLQITGSTLQSSPSSSGIGIASANTGNGNNIYSFLVSESIYSFNHNTGYPTANSWKENLQGSYFNNFDANTNVSEILRFIAGLLSQSAPDAAPNTRTFGSYSSTITGTTNNVVSIVPGAVPQNSTNPSILYLLSKSFMEVGEQLFQNYGASTNMYIDKFTINYTSVASGSSVVSSSDDSQLFGLGSLVGGNPTSFNVSGSFIHRFFNTQAETSITAESSSTAIITQTGAGTTNGVTLAKIGTVNPAVIPPNYQDGKFTTVFPQTLYSGSDPLTVSASGYYHISSSFRISSGSSPYTLTTSSNLEVFYAPLSLLNTTNIPAQIIQTSSVSLVAQTATSRSLSGAPYLSGSTYIFSSSISRSFSPLYATSSTLAQLTSGGFGITTTSGVTASSTLNGFINTANSIWDAAETTVRTAGAGNFPHETDRIRLNGLFTFRAGTAGSTNISGSGVATGSFSITANGRNRASTNYSFTNSASYHTAGAFGQPVSSGSLGYFGQNQGFDSGSLSGSRETFVGETFRLQISNNILSGSYSSGSKFTTSSFATYNLGALDLQVKPYRLVRPGGAYGYWLGDPDSTKDYKFYARAFQTDGTTKTQLTLDVGTLLSPWHFETATTCSAVIMFQSAQPGTAIPGGGGSTLPRAILYDPSVRTLYEISSSVTNDNFRNPFSPSIDLRGNDGDGNNLSGTTYTLPLISTRNQILDSTYRNFIVLIRYKNDASPISYIQIGH